MFRPDINKVEKLFERLVKSEKVHEAVLYINSSDNQLSWHKSYGGKTLDTPMLMASVTKLFITTCIFILLESKKLTLEDEIHRYLNQDMLRKLHVLKGTDYAPKLTIKNLLSQTSGLPDFYQGGKDSILKQVLSNDFEYNIHDELRWIKKMTPRFVPGAKEKAYYADINFDLLGIIIENIVGKPLKDVIFDYIIGTLELHHTYLASSKDINIPYSYYKDKRLQRTKFIQSSFASGGGVTTARELMIFIKAFWRGKLFNREINVKIAKSYPLQISFYPIHYAEGFMKIEARMPFGKKSVIKGHSGSTGSFAFYCPQKDIFLVGDVPQIANPSLAVRLVMKAVIAM